MPQVSARISQELYNKCIQNYGNITIAINTGLDELFKQSENKMNSSENRMNSNENGNGGLKAIIEEKDARIEDFKKQTYSLDNQLRTKDDQIEKLNENMHKQAVHIQTLIQEISQLNVKLIPENTENKKPWWKFW